MAIPGHPRSQAGLPQGPAPQGPAPQGPAPQGAAPPFQVSSPRPSSSSGPAAPVSTAASIAASAPGSLSPALSATPAPPAPLPAAPTNDDIEAVIQMAMAASTAASPRSTNPPRDTRTQLFVGNLPYRVRWQDLKDLFRRAGTVLRADVSLGPDNRSRGYGTVLLATAEDAGRAVDMFNGYCWQTRTLEVRPDRLGEDLPMGALAMNGALGMGNHIAGLGLGMLAGSSAAASLASNAAASSLPSPLGRYSNVFGVGGGEDELYVNGGTPMLRPSTGAGLPTLMAGPTRNLFVGNLPFHIQWQDLKDLFRQAGAVLRADVALGADGRSRGFGTVAFATEVDAERAVRMFNGYEFNGRPLKVHFDKFSAPASTAQLAVPVPGPHSSMGLAFGAQAQYGHSSVPTHAPALSHGASFAQQILQQQHEQAQAQSQATPSAFMRGAELGYAYDERDQEREVTGHPMHIAMPYRTSYAFEFLSSGPSTPYEQYGEPNVQSFFSRFEPSLPPPASSSSLSSSQPQPFVTQGTVSSQQTLPRPSTSPQIQTSSKELSPTFSSTHAHSHSLSHPQTHSSSHAHSQSQPNQNDHAQSQSQQQQQQHSHTHTHSHQHPAHPGPISLPPPPPVAAFPIPPAHTLSPPYSVAMSPMHPAMSPLHHPMMGMQMVGVSMTPHGLPPITPSMPSFTFLPQPSPGAGADPSSSGTSTSTGSSSNGGPMSMSMYDYEGAGRAVLHGHVLSPFGSTASFSPGATLSPGMSPGAFWGRPGASVNPFINPAVGAPVHPGASDAQHPHHYHWYYDAPRGGDDEDGALTPNDEDALAWRAQEQGYFPPVPVSMAMAEAGSRETAAGEPREPPEYFPFVPPPPPSSSSSSSVSRPSGLAREIAREDGSASGSVQSGEAPALRLPERRKPSSASGRASSGTGTGASASGAEKTPSSRGTSSWGADEEEEEDVAKRMEGLAVDGEEAVALGIRTRVATGAMGAGASASAKPRSYSAVASQASGTQMPLQRADSDPPVRAAAADGGARKQTAGSR